MPHPCWKSLLIGTLLVGTGGVCADTIQLKDGDTLHGMIQEENADSLLLKHPTLGQIRVPRSQITTLSKDRPAPAPAPAKTVSAAPPSGESPWKRKIGLGLYGTGSGGNTTNNNLHLFLDSEYEKEKDRWLFKSAYDLQEKEGTTTESRFFAQLDRDWTRNDSPWFWTARGRFDWDRFKEWRYRLGIFFGPGYQWIRTDTLNVRLRSGLGGTYDWQGENEGFKPEGQMGADLEWKITPHQSFDANTMFYIDLERASHYRNITSLGYSFDIDHIYRGLAFKLGLTNEYESEVAEGESKEDFKYNFTVTLDL